MINKIGKLREDAIIPEYRTENSCGLGIKLLNDDWVNSGGQLFVRTGLMIEIAINHFGMLKETQDMANRGLLILGGVIEEQFTDEICFRVANTSPIMQIFRGGDTIANLIVLSYSRCNKISVEE